MRSDALRSIPMYKRLLIVFLLGFSSGLPLALVSSTLQAWYADAGLSILVTGLLSLVSLPYAFRFAWTPIFDHYSLFSFGKRRSWILFTQVLLLFGFNILAWCSPNQSPKLMAIIALMVACFSASQDAVIDAHRVEYLPISLHGLGASLASLGYRLALFVSGGLALVIAQSFGWILTYRLMGAFMLIGVGAILLSVEPSKPLSKEFNFMQTFSLPLNDLFARPGIFGLLFFILFYKLGEAFTTTTSGIVMPFLIQGLGFSLSTIGYINKMMGISSLILGGLLAGFILIRWSLFSSLLIFGFIQAVTNLLFVLLALFEKNTMLLAISVGAANFAAGMGSTALVVFFMRLAKQPFTATQFSILVAISTIPHILSGPIAAFLQMSLGWLGLYKLVFALTFGFIPFLILIRDQTMEKSSLSAFSEAKVGA